MKIFAFLLKWSYFVTVGLWGFIAYCYWEPVVFDDPLAFFLFVLLSFGSLIGYLLVGVVLVVAAPYAAYPIEDRITGDIMLTEKLFSLGDTEQNRSTVVNWLMLLSTPLALLTSIKVTKCAFPDGLHVSGTFGTIMFAVAVTAYLAVDPVKLFKRLMTRFDPQR